jgi:hypothetical protein
MPVTISTIRLSKFGIQPLLIMSDQEGERMRRVIAAYIVWPEVPEGGTDAVRLFELSMPYVRGVSGQGEETLELLQIAADELALHHGGRLAAIDQFPPDAVTITPVDPKCLRAWRSVRLFPGLNNHDVFDGTAAEYLSAGLERPYRFAQE